MIRILHTTCGQSISRTVKRMDYVQQHWQRCALINATTKDNSANYMAISALEFIETDGE